MTVVVLAFEGIDGPILERFADDAPTIDSVRSRAITAPLEAAVPQAPVASWTSLFTGTDPSYHGIVDERLWSGYPGDEERSVSAVDVRRPTLWDYLSADGGRTVACGLPMTDPPGPLEGALVPGRATAERSQGRHDAGTSQPAEQPSVDRDHPTGRLPVGDPWTLPALDEQADVPELLERRRRVAVDLLTEEDWDLALVHVPVTTPRLLEKANAHRSEATFERTMRPTIAAADGLVAAVLEAIPPGATVVGCSPRGCRPQTGYRLHLNDLLTEAGLLAPRENHQSTTPGEAFDRPRTPADPDDAPGSGAHSITPLSSRAQSVGAIVWGGLRRLVAAVSGWLECHSRPRPDGADAGRAGVGQYDLPNAVAFCASPTDGGLWLNRAGREPAGRVVNSQVASLSAAIVERLREITDPEGDPVFEFVCKRRHLYDGPFDRFLPDVIYSTAGTATAISSGPCPSRGPPFTRVTGVRSSPIGTLFAAGPAIDTDAGTPDRPVTVADVGPLVMAALGRPVPALMTGRDPTAQLRVPVTRRTYQGVAHGTTVDDPSYDDGDLEAHLEGFEYRHGNS